MSGQPKRRDFTLPLLGVVAVGLAGLAYRQGGWALVWSGLSGGARLLGEVTPLLLAAFLVAGLVQVLISPEVVRRWLGASAGWRGLLLACVGGALMPGGPYVYYPIAAVLLHNGASLGVMVAFVTAKNLWSLSRLPLEFALLGPYLTGVRFLSTLLVPPLLGWGAEVLFGSHAERIRAAMHGEEAA